MTLLYLSPVSERVGPFGSLAAFSGDFLMRLGLDVLAVAVSLLKPGKGNRKEKTQDDMPQF